MSCRRPATERQHTQITMWEEVPSSDKNVVRQSVADTSHRPHWVGRLVWCLFKSFPWYRIFVWSRVHLAEQSADDARGNQPNYLVIARSCERRGAQTPHKTPGLEVTTQPVPGADLHPGFGSFIIAIAGRHGWSGVPIRTIPPIRRRAECPSPTKCRGRQFVGKSAFAGATVPLFVSSNVLAQPGKPGANDRIQLGLIGAGGMGRANLKNCTKSDDVAVAGICEVVEGTPRRDHRRTWRQGEAP